MSPSLTLCIAVLVCLATSQGFAVDIGEQYTHEELVASLHLSWADDAEQAEQWVSLGVAWDMNGLVLGMWADTRLSHVEGCCTTQEHCTYRYLLIPSCNPALLHCMHVSCKVVEPFHQQP